MIPTDKQINKQTNGWTKDGQVPVKTIPGSTVRLWRKKIVKNLTQREYAAHNFLQILQNFQLSRKFFVGPIATFLLS